MELTFYDTGGRAVAYSDDERHLYAFSGVPLAYIDGDSLYGFDGQHLGWWDRGWVRDHHGAVVFFTDTAMTGGPPLPARQPRPAKGLKNMPPSPRPRHGKPVRFVEGVRWSSRSGPQFFPSR
jgi:hypothetical protein